MTKPWDENEAKIRELYAKHTLKTVRETMQRENGFNASVRAYRKKLDEWGMTKYKPRENKSRNSPGEEPPRNEATNQQYPPNPGPSDQTSYNSPNAMMNPRETSWVQAQPSYYNVADWSQTTSYGQPMMTPNYGHQSTMNSNSMGQEQWYPNYQVSPPYTVAEATTSTAGWNVSQAPTNTPMMEFQADASDEYEEEGEEEEEEEDAQYQDSSQRSPTPGYE